MKRIVLAAVAALSLPAAALAHDEAYRQVRPPPPAPPAHAERREVAELRALTARLEEASPGRRDRRDLAWVEAELLRACDREIAEARVGQPPSWHEVPGSRRDLAATWSPPARARLDALFGVRAGLFDLRGRTDWASIRRASTLGHELTRLAALDVRYDPPPMPSGERGHERDERHDGHRG